MASISQDLSELASQLRGRVLEEAENLDSILVLRLGEACWLGALQLVCLQGKTIWVIGDSSKSAEEIVQPLLGQAIHEIEIPCHGRFQIRFESGCELSIVQDDPRYEWLHAGVDEEEFVAEIDE